jgi:hypothetical protein
MEKLPHLVKLRRAGWILVVVGVLDIATMVYRIVNRESHVLNLDFFFAVVAGILLIRGSLRTASIVRWVSVFVLSLMAATLVAMPFIQPVNLTLTQIRLGQTMTVLTFDLTLLFLGLLIFLTRELGSQVVLEARAAAGRKRRDMRIPIGIAFGLMVMVLAAVQSFLDGESAGQAQALAEKQLGPSYRYHLSKLTEISSQEGTTYVGLVTAWNDREVRVLRVQWDPN